MIFCNSYDKTREELLTNYAAKIMTAQAVFLEGSAKDMLQLKEQSERFSKKAHEKTELISKQLNDMIDHYKVAEA
jgi:hypothetical protein